MRLLDAETHKTVFSWGLERLVTAGLQRGNTLGVEATTLEANTVKRLIVQSSTGESYPEHLRKLPAANSVATDAAVLGRQDRKRKNKEINKVCGV